MGDGSLPLAGPQGEAGHAGGCPPDLGATECLGDFLEELSGDLSRQFRGDFTAQSCGESQKDPLKAPLESPT